jgi:hypothetical protein
MKKPKYAPELAFHDGDPIVYNAAFGVEKTRYRFVDAVGESVSPVFFSAKGAKKWLADEQYDDFSEETIDLDYTRQSFKKIGTEAEAIKNTQLIIQEYIGLVGKTVLKNAFYLTRSGDKHKTQSGTENMYQFNRAGSVKPVHYKAVRKYLETHPLFKLAPAGFEADNILCMLGEKHGANAVVTSLDKDMAQMEEAWFIHVDKGRKGVRFWCTSLGTLEHNGKKWIGTGFKWLAYQALAGDRADGYLGINKVGGQAVFNLIAALDGKEEVVRGCLDLYEAKFPDGIKYTSWDDKEMHLTPLELMEQHFNLAYMEKSPQDIWKASDILTGRVKSQPVPDNVLRKPKPKAEPKPKVIRTFLKDGLEVTTDNVAQFSRDNDLSSSAMSAVASGRQKQHKGYTLCLK